MWRYAIQYQLFSMSQICYLEYDEKQTYSNYWNFIKNIFKTISRCQCRVSIVAVITNVSDFLVTCFYISFKNTSLYEILVVDVALPKRFCDIVCINTRLKERIALREWISKMNYSVLFTALHPLYRQIAVEYLIIYLAYSYISLTQNSRQGYTLKTQLRYICERRILEDEPFMRVVYFVLSWLVVLREWKIWNCLPGEKKIYKVYKSKGGESENVLTFIFLSNHKTICLWNILHANKTLLLYNFGSRAIHIYRCFY